MNVIIDDRDPSIQYSPSWTTAGFGLPEEYQMTTSVPAELHDTAQFTFTGTSVSVFGTVAGPEGPENGLGMNFNVDGGPVEPLNSPVPSAVTHHQLLWSSPSLPFGTHVLLMNSTSKASRIYVDYILYETTLTAGKTVFVDDNDTGLQYSSGWKMSNDESNFQHTAHVNKAAGSWAFLTFNGTSLSLFGSVNGTTATNATAVVDGKPPVSITTKPSEANTLLPLFTSSTLDAGSHTVNITVLNDAQFTADYFLITSPLAAEATSSSTNQASQTVSATSVPSSDSSHTLSSATPAVTVFPDSNSPSLMAEIVGPILGLVLLVLLGVVLLKHRRKQRKRLCVGPESSTSTLFLSNPAFESRRWWFQRRVPLQPPSTTPTPFLMKEPWPDSSAGVTPSGISTLESSAAPPRQIARELGPGIERDDGMRSSNDLTINEVSTGCDRSEEPSFPPPSYCIV